MDAVITYVNGLDPVWQKQYGEATHQPVLAKRYRDWGLLRYLLRGIECYMPFIERVFLVVSGESQVPEWADTEHLHIVYHRDIIPEKLLPTFNCNPIELHLQNIEGLNEQYIYFNDDIFPLKPCQVTDFYRNGKVCIGFSKHLFSFGMFKKITKKSDSLAKQALGMKPSCLFIRPQHICTPMLKSEVNALYSTIKKELIESLSTVREAKNANQYVYTDYLYYKGKAIDRHIPSKHCSMAVYSVESIVKQILSPSKPLICLNDVEMSDNKQEEMRTKLHEAFEAHFPTKSRFEKRE